jgi:hypothetical protein
MSARKGAHFLIKIPDDWKIKYWLENGYLWHIAGINDYT